MNHEFTEIKKYEEFITTKKAILEMLKHAPGKPFIDEKGQNWEGLKYDIDPFLEDYGLAWCNFCRRFHIKPIQGAIDHETNGNEIYAAETAAMFTEEG